MLQRYDREGTSTTAAKKVNQKQKVAQADSRAFVAFADGPDAPRPPAPTGKQSKLT